MKKGKSKAFYERQSLAKQQRKSKSNQSEQTVDVEGTVDMGMSNGTETVVKKTKNAFTCFELSEFLLKAIDKLKYKQPTPIQRKSIPIIMQGKDCVSMARTGSGKTASFLIPIIERLKCHSPTVGVRALILSPSRELAQQTLTFCQKLAKFSDLRSVAVIGGAQMESQFAMLQSNPDIIIGTPGRLLHLIIETKLELSKLEILCFDECDRLFEMGFKEQLNEIIHKIPETRQTLLFSATLPRVLVDFARAGLVSPTLIRLDVESKMSSDLELFCFSVKAEEKIAALLYLLSHIIDNSHQTVVFVSTKHHVELVNEILGRAGFSTTFIYGALDQQARKENLLKFRNNLAKILVVTDLAARGLDIPLLDNVINYDFAPSAKVFIHRVGRVARAGRPGKAYNFISADEMPFLFDLAVFSSRSVLLASAVSSPDYCKDLVVGTMPSAVALEADAVKTMISTDVTLKTLLNSANQAAKMFRKSRTAVSTACYDRAKEYREVGWGIHPLFIEKNMVDSSEREQEAALLALKDFRPPESVFEIGKRGKTAEALLMARRRSALKEVVGEKRAAERTVRENLMRTQTNLIEANDADLEGFIISGKSHKKRIPDPKNLEVQIKREQKKAQREAEKIHKMEHEKQFKMEYRPADDATEKGYAAAATMDRATIDIIPDDTDGLRSRKQQHWDSKKHDFVRVGDGGDNIKRIKTETGAKLPATFDAGRYNRWQNKFGKLPSVGATEAQGTKAYDSSVKRYRYNTEQPATKGSQNLKRKVAAMEKDLRKKGFSSEEVKKRKSEFIEQKTAPTVASLANKGKNELLTVDQVVKMRVEKDKRREKTGRHFKAKKKK